MTEAGDEMSRKTTAKITTKTGDAGLTGVLGPERLPKEDPRIEALGAVDEATSALGLARAWCDTPYIYDILLHVQRNLYTLMAELATTTQHASAIGQRITGEDVAWLERTQEDLLTRVEIPPRFILPGDTRAGATLDVARSTVRRAERAVSRLLHMGSIANGEALRYLNRLSDMVFVLARLVEAPTGGSTQARILDAEQNASRPGSLSSVG
ncbi:MAG TPA: cob(I)yrinic acid a,c-diamide adenosyltransferase [Ktedonobacterales bacterium]|nr:cob(I)yrinic acid a,c-diamide adenosyltransferase [Ktedonobacterales bacterium]